MSYSAIIFDLDGTILDNEGVYGEAFGDVLTKQGAKISGPSPQTFGIGLEENINKLKKEFKLEGDAVVISHQVQDAYHARLGEVKIRPGFFELYDSLKEQGKLISLATSNNWWVVEDELQDLGLENFFDSIVTREEVEFGKPAPDLFLEAARKLGAEYHECIVIEDSVAGVQASKNAGMAVVVILNGFTKKEDFPEVDLIVSSFEEITPVLLEKLHKEKTLD